MSSSVALSRGCRRCAWGDPMDESTDVGPLATADIRRDLHDQVRRSVDDGARLLCGGRPLDGPGWFYAPTVLAGVPPGSPAAAEELFGPVAAVWRAHDLDEAIVLANSTPYGLGASVWTQNEGEAARLTDEIDAGMVFVNGIVASDPRLPLAASRDPATDVSSPTLASTSLST